ncbi:hypothetical protein J4456_00430 [Candidatus Pacearchaeota archaeon]|nr:hypothetical protein [Candidatus Pacearchaeota archaeon]
MGLLTRIFGREEFNPPLTIMVYLQDDLKKEEAMEKLKELGIQTCNSISFVPLLICRTSRDIYESVFNAKLVRGNPLRYLENTPEGYKQKKAPIVPQYLEAMVKSVSADIMVTTPEHAAEYHRKSESIFSRIKNYFTRR